MNADIRSLIIYISFLSATMVILWMYQNLKIKSKLSKVIILLLACLPLSLLAGLRDGVGTDYNSYCNAFNFIKQNTVFDGIQYSGAEPLFVVIVKAISLINPSNEFIFFGIEFLTLYLVIISLSKFQNDLSMPIAFAIYYLSFFHMSLNIVRQLLALSIIFYGIYYLINKKYMVYVAITLCASFIHTSSVLCLSFLIIPFLFRFYKKDKSLKKNLWFSHFLFYLGIALSPFFIGRFISLILTIPAFSRYAHRVVETSEVSIGIGTIAYVVILIIPVIVVAFKQIERNERFTFLQNLFIMYLPISFIGYFVTWASRVNLYPLIIIVIFIPMVIRKLKGNAKILLSGYYIVVFIGMYTYDILLRNLNETFPYNFV